MYTVAVFNHQQGVGKTSLTANLGHALALAGCQVTVIDFDPKGDLSVGLGLFRPPRQGIDQVLLGEVDLESVSISTRDEMHLIPAGLRLAEMDQEAGSSMDKGLQLSRVLSTGLSGQDYLMFDCPSSTGLLAANILLGVDLALIPVIDDDTGMAAMPYLLETIQRFAAARRRPLAYRFLMNRIHTRRRLTGASAKFLRLAPGHFLKSVICESALLPAAQQVGRTIFEYRPNSRSAKDFSKLAQEFMPVVAALGSMSQE